MANAKRVPKKGIMGEATISLRVSKRSNRLHLAVRLTKEDEQRLFKMLKKRYSKMK